MNLLKRAALLVCAMAAVVVAVPAFAAPGIVNLNDPASQNFRKCYQSSDGTGNGVISQCVVLIDPTTGLPYTASGGGGGGAMTVADGADVAQGTTTDAACATDNGNCTIEALIKRSNQRLTTLNATLTAMAAPATSGAATATTSQLAGCYYTTTIPTLTDTQQGAVRCDSRGGIQVSLFTGSTAWTNLADNADGVSATSTTVQASKSVARTTLFNGTTWDRQYSIQGATAGAGLGVTAVAEAPSSATAAGVAPVVTSAVAGSLVLKSGAGNLYAVDITTGASAGYLLMFNATSAPADGAVTPNKCWAVAANTSFRPFINTPVNYTTGITAVFSTTGCFTKTISATAFISGEIK